MLSAMVTHAPGSLDALPAGAHGIKQAAGLLLLWATLLACVPSNHAASKPGVVDSSRALSISGPRASRTERLHGHTRGLASDYQTHSDWDPQECNNKTGVLLLQLL